MSKSKRKAEQKVNQEEKLIVEARKKLWAEGILEWKLDTVQKQAYNFINNHDERLLTLVIHRRAGKTFMLAIMAVEYALRNPKSIIHFIQPEQKMIRRTSREIMSTIFEDCPTSLKPKYKTQDSIYSFPNGSEIQLAGADSGQHEKLRGASAHLAIVDEAGFINNELNYIIKSVIFPATLLTKGKIILSSTPAKEPDHDFEEWRKAAVLNNTLIQMTVHDTIELLKNDPDPRITPEMLYEYIKTYPGGEDSDDYKREMLCQTIYNSDNSVVPEFTEELEKDIVVPWARPPFCDRYVAMDVGFSDFTAVLFAYYDFDNGVVVVEDELLMRGPTMTLQALAEAIKKKEEENWTDPVTADKYEPFLRISDNNLVVINDLARQHGLFFMATPKDNKDAALNEMRTMIDQRQVIINPKCTNLIHHLKNATWKKNRKEFNRSVDSGHYDAIDALVYLIRNINKNKNPYPKGIRRNIYRADGGVFVNPYSSQNVNSQHDAFKQLFKPKSRFNK